ncbi:40S ribosomal protein S4-like [Senna tora]|uniref:40S ribosomal protein S4-like n=1 Tax=Senna tora TaxID=362788 RepID=A0A834T8Q0_9FABA|nr:40S ribosomal protein S4-like [Senna tora]
MVTGGRNRGRVGIIKRREKHMGTFDTIHVQHAVGNEFGTRLENVFIIGQGSKPWIGQFNMVKRSDFTLCRLRSFSLFSFSKDNASSIAA